MADTQFHVVEFRGFEKFCEGRFFAEMPQITARICGICPVSHLLASAKACDAVLGVEIPRPAKLLRELMHMGQLTQSHALSFFHLSAPDLLLGYDADPAIRNVVGLIQQHPDIALKGVRLRKFGQEVIKHVGGRQNPRGFPRARRRQQGAHRRRARRDAQGLAGGVGAREVRARPAQEISGGASQEVETFASFDSNYMGLVQPDGALEHYDGKLRFSRHERQNRRRPGRRRTIIWMSSPRRPSRGRT